MVLSDPECSRNDSDGFAMLSRWDEKSAWSRLLSSARCIHRESFLVPDHGLESKWSAGDQKCLGRPVGQCVLISGAARIIRKSRGSLADGQELERAGNHGSASLPPGAQRRGTWGTHFLWTSSVSPAPWPLFPFSGVGEKMRSTTGGKSGSFGSLRSLRMTRCLGQLVAQEYV